MILQCGNGKAAAAKGNHRSQKKIGGGNNKLENNFSSVAAASSPEGIAELKQWSDLAYDLRQASSDPAQQTQLKNIENYSRSMARYPSNTVLIKDKNGQVQAAIEIDNNQSKDAVYIALLATHPNNVAGKGIKGAGSAAIAKAIAISLESGKGGAVKLDSVDEPETINFYQKIGFKPKTTHHAFGLVKMLLSAEDAQSYLANYELKYGKIN